jgi:cellobiose phosphorylase
VTRLLGLRIEWGNVTIDPVMPLSLDGLTVSMNFMSRRVSFRYVVRVNTSGPERISINGRDAVQSTEDNPYRRGGAVIQASLFSAMLDRPDNSVDVYL